MQEGLSKLFRSSKSLTLTPLSTAFEASTPKIAVLSMQYTVLLISSWLGVHG
jgi:hypothetical protein